MPARTVGRCGLGSAEGAPTVAATAAVVWVSDAVGMLRGFALSCPSSDGRTESRRWGRRTEQELFLILELWNGAGRKSCVHFQSRKRGCFSSGSRCMQRQRSFATRAAMSCRDVPFHLLLRVAPVLSDSKPSIQSQLCLWKSFSFARLRPIFSSSSVVCPLDPAAGKSVFTQPSFVVASSSTSEEIFLVLLSAVFMCFPERL